jgi:hypothetical protein
MYDIHVWVNGSLICVSIYLGHAQRQNNAIQRRVYRSPGPHHLWHIDGNHKLKKRFSLVIEAGVDGFSRTCVFSHCSNSNSSETVLNAYLQGVEEYGRPSRVRTDKGMENVLVADDMILNRGPDRGSVLTGRSVHNQRIERFWRDVKKTVIWFYYNHFM